MLEYLIQVFGSNLWNYAILEATHWSYEKKQVLKYPFSNSLTAINSLKIILF